MDRLDDRTSADHWATDLRDLLVALPAWSLVMQRKAFVEAALDDHPAAAERVFPANVRDQLTAG
jgi:hypothetical protein